MQPRHEYTDQFLSDLPLGKEHLENLMPKDLFKVLACNGRGNPESPLAKEATVRAKNVARGPT